MGAGAAMAIEDAYVLNRLLEPKSGLEEVVKAFKDYDSIRRQRSQELIWMARLCSRTYSFRDDHVGNDIEKMQRELTKRFHWLWDEDMEVQVEKFKGNSTEADS